MHRHIDMVETVFVTFTWHAERKVVTYDWHTAATHIQSLLRGYNARKPFWPENRPMTRETEVLVINSRCVLYDYIAAVTSNDSVIYM